MENEYRYKPRSGWEGNHIRGVALIMCHILYGISTCGLSGLRKEDEHIPPTLLYGVWQLYILHNLISSTTGWWS